MEKQACFCDKTAFFDRSS